LEWGTKHVHMANMRPGYGAGEIVVRIDEATGQKTIHWNTKSGCFSRMLVDQVSHFIYFITFSSYLPIMLMVWLYYQ
jgi:hypothetical protein